MDSDDKQLKTKETFDQQHVDLPQQHSTSFENSQPPAYDGPAAAYLPPYPISGTQEQMNQTTMALSQPGSLTPMAPPTNYLGLAIFTTVCCCFPFGILAIVKSVEVIKAVRRGDEVTARKASQCSQLYSMFGIIFATVFLVCFIIISTSGW